MLPIPRSQRLREIRLRILPVVVFFLVLLFVIYLWDVRVRTASFTARVHGETAVIVAPETGLLRVFNINLLDEVSAGDTLAVILRHDSSYVRTQSDLFQAKIKLAALSPDPVSDWQRNHINLTSLRIETISEESDLLMLKLQRDQQQRDYDRIKQMYDAQLVSDAELEASRLALEMSRAAITVRENQIVQLKRQLETLSASVNQFANDTEVIAAHVEVIERELDAFVEEMKPVILRASLSGVVSVLYNSDNTYVTAGTQLMEIHSPVPGYITGYVKQPLMQHPKPGMRVQIRTRSPERRMYGAVVERVGSRFTFVDPQLSRSAATPIETGLPVIVRLDAGQPVSLIPGEIVDVVLDR